MTSERKDYQVAKLPFPVFFEAVNKRERDKLYKVVLIAKITAKSVLLALNQIIVIV